MILIPVCHRGNTPLLSEELIKNIVPYVMVEWKFEKYFFLGWILPRRISA